MTTFRRIAAAALLALTITAGSSAFATAYASDPGKDPCGGIPNCQPPNPDPGPWIWDVPGTD